MSDSDSGVQVYSAITDDLLHRYVRWHGILTAEVAFRFLKADPTAVQRREGSAIFDFRNATPELTYDTARRLGNHLVELGRSNRSRLSFVVGNNVTYGTMRMFIVASEDLYDVASVFYDWDEAVAWSGIPATIITELEAKLSPVNPVD